MEKKYAAMIDFVYINCIEAAELLGFTLYNEDVTNGIIYFRVGLSFLSFGETIEVRLTDLGNGTTSTQVKSSAVQLITWGKNAENETKFIDRLNQLVKTT